MSLSKLVDFGVDKAPVQIVEFSARSVLLLVPGMFLGHFLDRKVEKAQKNKMLGDNPVTYLLAQIISMILVWYLLFTFDPQYVDEFQRTYAGVFFVGAFFGVQSNFFANWRQYFEKWY